MTDSIDRRISSGTTAREAQALVQDVLDGRKLIVVSNREPYEHMRDKDRITVKKTVSGLVTALDPLLQELPSATWIAWGSGNADRDVVDEHDSVMMPPKTPVYRLRRIWLTDEEVKDFYEGHVNQTLWPLYHLQTEKVRYFRNEWDAYQSVNRRFAEAVAEELTDERGIVWFQDYQFATAPAMLRMLKPEATILHFWHIPWPPWEIFRQHPQRRAILEGMLGCDLIGMHIDLFCENFLDCVRRELNIPVDFERGHVIVENRTVRVRSFPISVDAEHLDQLARSSSTEKSLIKDREKYGRHDLKIGVSVERSDYIKGIVLRLSALEHFFEHYPMWRGKFTLIQVTPLSRQNIPAYAEYQSQVNRDIHRLNARFATENWQPVIHIRTAKSTAELSSLYRLADVAIVSARQDGMNLVAKEFIASRIDEKGVLMLSEFAGASEEMPQSLIINPHDIEHCALMLHQALQMPEAEQKRRMRQLRLHLFQNTIFDWIESIFAEVAEFEQWQDGRPRMLLDHLESIKQTMNKYPHVELFCDYDGVLSPIAARPVDAHLDDQVREYLTKLRDSASVHVSVISGRSLSDLMDLVKVERLTYAGNHGLEISGPRVERIHEDAEHLHAVMQKVYGALREEMRPFPGVIIEDKQLGVAMHYRLADPQITSAIIDTFYRVLEQFNAENLLRATSGKFVLEVRPNIAWDKGRAVLWLLRMIHGANWREEVLPFYLGDDVTDEDAFHALRHKGITVLVGPVPSHGTAAKYRLDQTSDVLTFLEWMTQARE